MCPARFYGLRIFHFRSEKKKTIKNSLERNPKGSSQVFELSLFLLYNILCIAIMKRIAFVTLLLLVSLDRASGRSHCELNSTKGCWGHQKTFETRIGTASPFDGIDVGGNSAPILIDIDGDSDLD